MDIPFHYQFDSTSWAFIMTVDLERSVATNDGDVPRLNIAATFKLPPLDSRQIQDKNLVILDLHGKLCRPTALQDSGGTLLPNTELPINLLSPTTSYPISLSFAFSPRYLQLLEEQRAIQQDHVMILGLQMWGTIAIVKKHEDLENAYSLMHNLSYDLVRFERVLTDQAPSTYLRFERSMWIDRILPNLGYHQTVLVELPLIHTPPFPDMYSKAVEALDMANKAFKQEDYRAAIKYGREVLEYIGDNVADKKLTSFCKEHLEPLVGETKSKAIDMSLNAMRTITSASSHANHFAADRATASYVIEMLSLNLRYIAAILR